MSSDSLAGVRGALESLLGPAKARRFSDDDLLRLKKAGYDTLEDLKDATRTGLADAKLKPARADLIIKAQGSSPREGVVERWKSLSSPSSVDQLIEQQLPEPLVCNWRPASNFGLPPELAHPAFGTFLDVLANPTPSQEDLNATRKLCQMASMHFVKEADLEAAVHRHLMEYMGTCIIKGTVRADKGCMQADGMIIVTDSDDVASHRLVSVMEVKLGLGSGDSNFQGACYHGGFWATRLDSDFMQRTCCPALLLEVVGPMLRVSALYWAKTVVIRPLTSCKNLLWMADNEAYMISVARVLAAYKAAVAELTAFYSKPAPAPAARPPGVHQLPYPLLEPGGRYTNIMPEQCGRLVFRAIASTARSASTASTASSASSASSAHAASSASSARAASSASSAHAASSSSSASSAHAASRSSSKPVIVRFTRRYGASAHRAWAAAALAPKLYGVRRLLGGWLEVEMELLEEEDGWMNLLEVVVAAASGGGAAAGAQARGGGCMGSSPALPHVVAAVEAALSRAHSVTASRGGSRFAHGDMRPQNIMVRWRGQGSGGGGTGGDSSGGAGEGGGTQYDVRFLDFEFAGKDGIARYPAYLNTDVAWPAGVEFNAPVLQAHDTALLSTSITQLLSAGSNLQPQPRDGAAAAGVATSAARNAPPASADDAYGVQQGRRGARRSKQGARSTDRDSVVAPGSAEPDGSPAAGTPGASPTAGAGVRSRGRGPGGSGRPGRVRGPKPPACLCVTAASMRARPVQAHMPRMKAVWL